MWPGKHSKKSSGAGMAMRGSVLVRGFDSTSFQPISGPGEGGRVDLALFSYFGGVPLGPHYFFLLYPYSPGVAVLYISV